MTSRTSIYTSSKWNIPFVRRNIRHCQGHVSKSRIVCVAESRTEFFEAAKLTVDIYVKNGMVVGLGSGAASGIAIQHLGKRLKDGSLRDIVGIPSSTFSATEATNAGVPLNNYEDGIQIDFAFNDADVMEEGSLLAVIGRRKLEGGESFVEEKMIAASADKFAFIVAEEQYTKEIYGSIPVVINCGNWLLTAEEIDDLFLGDAEVWRRPAFGNADPLGGDFPLVTTDGHHVLDVIFTSPILDLGEVAESIIKVPGVVDHGIIHDIPCFAVIASKNQVKLVDKTSVIS
ncbi:Ribose-5-phosphate isomerase A [Rhynchospora pubera]|uniref:ribose-5-phosphate isomerase n=1 Tax=Rhynchospora pubera TaxID=906938 RepID=A0AAV8C7M9_9POAL|nr:Ribose-5-phosphate isomerase A [Rhynchospora pubera]